MRGLWIGGPPCCGKTTVATWLARRHGLRLYSADTRTWVHRDRAIAAGSAPAIRWESLPPAERWERATPAEMHEMSLHRERGPMVLDDLRALPPSPLVVAEGSTLPAAAMASGAADRSRAVWLIPTAAFQRSLLAARRTPDGHARLYVYQRDLIEREARAHGVPILSLDGSAGVAQTAAAVEERFSAALAAGPVARATGERRTLLREMNEAAVGQVRGYCARPWARLDADAVVRDFVCECGDPACEALVRLPVGEVAGAPAVAPGHVR